MLDVIRPALIALHGMWHHRWAGLLVAWAVAVLGGIALWAFPDRYESSARIYVDTQSVLKPLMAGLAVQPNIDQQVMMLGRTLLSRPNVEKVIDSAGLVKVLSAADRDALADRLMRRIQISGTGKDNLFTLSYRDTDPLRAKKVVDSLTIHFVNSGQTSSRQDSAEAKAFVESQVRIYEQKLQEAEARLKDFRLQHLGVAEGGQSYFAKMEDVSDQLNRSRLELREAENVRDSLKRQLAGEEPLVSLSSRSVKPPVSELDVRIDTLSRNLDGLLQHYTDQHPEVVGARRMIAELEVQRRREIASSDKNEPRIQGAISSTNPVYQQLRVSLAQAEGNVASLRVRVAEFESRYARLRGAGRQVPQVEAELAQLNRDYEVNKKNYEGLVARREQAQISGNMESAGGAEFRIIDPARLPTGPVKPNRLMLIPLLLIGCLAAGAGTCLMLSRASPTFIDPETLRAVTGLPVLGGVSILASRAQLKQRWQSVLGFISALGALVSGFFVAFGVVFVQTMQIS